MSATRRGLLGSAAVLAAVPGVKARATTAGHPDAELIAVCAEFDICERLTTIIHGSGPDCVVDDAEAAVVSAPTFARMEVLLARMDELQAKTPAGIQARAHSLAQRGGLRENSFDYEPSIEGRLLTYLMRDSARLGGSPSSIVASPDADLLAACTAFDDLERAYIACGGEWLAGSPEDIAAEAERDRLHIAQEPLVDRMIDLRATTREGHAARARSLALWDAELLKPGSGDVGTCLTAALVRDLIGGSAVA